MSLFKFFGRRAEAASAREPQIPVGERVYAIGDIHGRDDLFAHLLEQIALDNDRRTPAYTRLILLGDLVDRGPASAAVVERARGLGAPFDKVHWLIGNHEEAFLAALGGDITALKFFVRIGGDATIRSYWQDDAAYAAATFEELSAQLGSIVPQSHIDFLGNGEDMVRVGDYAFVHAGVRPGVDLDRQKTSDLRWIRGDFLDDRSDFGAMIVYGHTISDTVDERPNRIGIDTGAYASGCLTAIGLESGQRWYLDTREYLGQ